MKRKKTSLHRFLSKLQKETIENRRQTQTPISEDKVKTIAETMNMKVSNFFRALTNYCAVDCFLLSIKDDLIPCVILYEVIQGRMYISTAIYKKEQGLIKRVGRTKTVWEPSLEKTLSDIPLNNTLADWFDKIFQRLSVGFPASKSTKIN